MSRDSIPLNYWRPEDRLGLEEKEIIPLLWPAYAWKVIAPQPRRGGLNLLQHAVLAARRAGDFPPEILADRLGLHPKLIAIIEDELSQLDLIDAGTRYCTEKGRTSLENEGEVWEGAYTGYVFQNALDGKLFPFFAPELIYSEGKFGGPTGASVKFGSKWLPAYVIEASDGGSLPTSTELSRTLRAHHQRQKNLRFMDAEWGDDRSTGASDPVRGTNLDVVESTPLLVRLLTVGRVSREGAEATLDDFFGRGEAPALWTDLMRYSERHDSKTNRDCVATIRALAVRQREPDLEMLRRADRTEAESRVREVLSSGIERSGVIFGHLVRMELDLADAERDLDDPWHRWGNAQNNARKTLEALLKEIDALDPETQEIAHLIPKVTEDESRAVLNAHATSMGFTIPLPMEYRIGTNERKTLNKRWRAGRSFNLQHALIALLLRASQVDGHLLRSVAKREPRFFHLVSRVKTEGNRGSHDNETNQFTSAEDTREAIKQMRTDCHCIVALLLNLPTPTATFAAQPNE